MKDFKPNSGKDINDKMMREAGFFRNKMDNPSFNVAAFKPITYWSNEIGLNVITCKKEKMTLNRLVFHVANQAAYWTRRQIRRQMDSIDMGVKGYVPFKEVSHLTES